MKKIQKDLALLSRKRIAYNEADGIGTFGLRSQSRQPEALVSVLVGEDGAWQFFPERSSSQRKLLAILDE